MTTIPPPPWTRGHPPNLQTFICSRIPSGIPHIILLSHLFRLLLTVSFPHTLLLGDFDSSEDQPGALKPSLVFVSLVLWGYVSLAGGPHRGWPLSSQHTVSRT